MCSGLTARDPTNPCLGPAACILRAVSLESDITLALATRIVIIIIGDAPFFEGAASHFYTIQILLARTMILTEATPSDSDMWLPPHNLA